MNSPYDRSDPESIESFAKNLEGKSLGDFVSEESRSAYSGKGQLGTAVETQYFGYSANSRAEPDFAEAGVELKVTPLKRLKNGKLVPKERLVLGMIDYDTIASESWDTSSFLKKNAKLLLIFYVHKEGSDFWDHEFKRAALWEIPPEDMEVIRNDWETIAEKVRSGRAHELSEGDTLYLAACTKGATADSNWRPQPYSAERAKGRAFSFKPSYMSFVAAQLGVPGIKRSGSKLPLRAAAQLLDMATMSFEEIVEKRFAQYAGMTAKEIADKLGVATSSAKSFHALVTRCVLGTSDSSRIAEFEKADIQVRTVRLKMNGVPKESVSFRAFDYFDLAEQEWDSSDWRAELSKRFLFVVYRIDAHGEARFVGVKFWTMPVADLENDARWVFDATVARIKGGAAESLPGMRDNPVGHVRPHARDSKDTLPTPQGIHMVKKSFWLNASYVAEQLGPLAGRRVRPSN